MKRRKFIRLGAGALAAGGLTACAGEQAGPATAASKDRFTWKMVTTWPPNFPGLGTGAVELARNIEAMSAGRLKVKVYAGGELVPAFEAFDTVSAGTTELGHSAAYYWKGKSEATQLFGAVPFGMNAMETNAWLQYGGGLELWRELYADFNVIPFPCGSTGVQMGGWFNREINSVDDLKGLKMRIPGLGADILRRAGGTPVSMPGGDIYTSLETGNIDATEWIGPYNDLAFGLHKAAKYYYYPGWHEPSATIELLVNKDAYDGLPEDLKAIVAAAASSAADRMVAEFTARNSQRLQTLIDEYGVQVRSFPKDVLDALRSHAREALEEIAARDPVFAKIHASYMDFYRQIRGWHEISERAYYEARG